MAGATSTSGPAGGLAEPITVTVPEAAKLLGVGRAVAYRMTRTGEIPTVRIGPRMVRVPLAELRRWIAERTEGGEPASAV
jgi:excisionase family DNA binding protein